jgi:hypothetical protein
VTEDEVRDVRLLQTPHLVLAGDTGEKAIAPWGVIAAMHNGSDPNPPAF